MYPSEARDLVVSVLIYLGAILFGLALFVVPIYLASRPTVVENAGSPALAGSVDRTLASGGSGGQRFPVAHIKRQTIVNPATLTELNAEAEKSENSARVRVRSYQPIPSAARAEAAPASRRGAYPNISTRF
jgi:hypothetical protein